MAVKNVKDSVPVEAEVTTLIRESMVALMEDIGVTNEVVVLKNLQAALSELPKADRPAFLPHLDRVVELSLEGHDVAARLASLVLADPRLDPDDGAVDMAIEASIAKRNLQLSMTLDEEEDGEEGVGMIYPEYGLSKAAKIGIGVGAGLLTAGAVCYFTGLCKSKEDSTTVEFF